MYVLVLLFPLLSFLQASVGGFFFGRKLSSFFSVFFLFFSFMSSMFMYFEVMFLGVPVNVVLFQWMLLDMFSINFGLWFDNLTVTMLVVITGMSFFVHLYSTEYMSHDPFVIRFLGYLSLFTFFMLILVTADNFVQLFMGWEGVGLCSYLLMNFWFTRVLANKAAIKAMLMNSIADVFFVLAVCILLLNFGSSNYFLVFITILPTDNFFFGNLTFSLLQTVCFFLFMGAMGKSAQMGFHTWLPDAMEGPTPVSSLLHAATMVTAGVFLVLRCAPLFEHAPTLLCMLAIFGGMTAFFSAFVAVFQWDLKKVIAYSTCSQLGYMFLACGFSFYSVALFHLFNHAFFKALLFLSAGSMMHALDDEQDMSRMGGLARFLPFTFICMFFASLAIMGFPFLTGFYSKDLILELLMGSFVVDGLFFYILAMTAAFLTAVYSMRLLIFVFFTRSVNYLWSSMPQESAGPMSAALFFLALASLFAGFIFSELYVGWGASLTFFSFPENDSFVPLSLLTPFQRNLPLMVSISGVFLSLLSSFLWKKVLSRWFLHYIKVFYSKLATFFFHSGFFNVVYNCIFNYMFVWSYTYQTKLMDKGILEFLGPVGLYRLMNSLSLKVRRWPNLVFFQIGSMFFSLIAWLIFIIFNTGLMWIGGFMPLFFLVFLNEMSLKLKKKCD